MSAIISKSIALKIVVIAFFCVASLVVWSQPFEGLHSIDKFQAKIHFSVGHEQRAIDLGGRVDNAIAFNETLLGFKPEVTILILSQADWPKHTSFPVYGMPHYRDDKTLIVASSDNAYWKSFIPPLDQVTPSMATQIKRAYSMADGSLSMQPFFDLLALHELGHAFHKQRGLTMQRNWLGELFCNIFLHTYIAENEPDQLLALTVFPQMVVAGGTNEFSFTTLKQLQENYNLIGKQYPKNYGWYQCRLHVGAEAIYNSSGNKALTKVWNALKITKTVLTDETLVEFLHSNVDPSVARVIRDW